jgi:hypothetical protein
LVLSHSVSLYYACDDSLYGDVATVAGHGRTGFKRSYRPAAAGGNATVLVHDREPFSISFVTGDLLSGRVRYATRMHLCCLWLRRACLAWVAVASGAGRCVRPRRPMGSAAKLTAPRGQLRAG